MEERNNVFYSIIKFIPLLVFALLVIVFHLALLPGVFCFHRQRGVPHPGGWLFPAGYHQQKLSELSDRGLHPAAHLYRLGPFYPRLRVAEDSQTQQGESLIINVQKALFLHCEYDKINVNMLSSGSFSG